MRRKFILICFLLIVLGQQKLSAQLPIIGKSFFALSVKNADSVANWYTSTFNLKSIKEINDTAMGVVVKIIGNDNMVIEILQMKDSKTAMDWGLKSNFQMHGFVKVGFFVTSLEAIQQHLNKKGIEIKYGPFNDKETKTKNLIISDCEDNLIQFFEDIK
jgi:hypothetical protein